MSDVLNLLIQAIKTRRCAIIRYAGQQQIRVVEPHAIYTDDAGSIVVECLQTRGYSSPDAIFPFWQMFQLKNITSVMLLSVHFDVRVHEGYKPISGKYQQGLLAQVSSAGTETLYKRVEKPVSLLFYQTRELWSGGQDRPGQTHDK